MSDPTATTAPAPIGDDTLLRFVWLGDPRISPDGSRVAFVRVAVNRDEDAYETQLWIASTAGGDPRPLTSGTRDSQPRWSPDGTRLAFVRAAEPKKPGQIWVLPMDGGEARPVTSLAKGASSPAWSPDGARLAFLSDTNPALDTPEAEAAKPKNEPARVVTRPVFRENNVGFHDFDRPSHVWVVPAAGGDARALTNGRFNEGAPQWSRDGRRVLFTSDRRLEPWFGPEHSVVYAVAADLESPTDGAALEPVLDVSGPVADFREGPDGKIAAIGYTAREPMSSYQQSDLLLGEGARPVTIVTHVNPGGRYAVGEGTNGDQHPPRAGGGVALEWSADGRAVFAGAAREGAAMLVRFEAASGEARELTPADRDVVAASCTPGGERWALVIGSVATPGDLYVLDAAGGLRKLWGPNDALLAAHTLGEVETMWFEGFDGRRVQGWIVKPPGFDPARKYPAILEIHGGPHTAYGYGFFHEFHHLASAGYVVLYTNPRGSTSYGEAFANVIQYEFGVDDGKDLQVAVEKLVERGYVDPKRIGVTGGSYGGYMTNWLVALDDRFAAAVTQRCVSDWRGMYDSCDFSMYVPFWMPRPPFEDDRPWIERSPISKVTNIRTPLMIVHSEEDWRTPIAQGESMFRALKHLKRPVVMVRFPGENHELSRSGTPSRRVQAQRHIRGWFDRWLNGADKPEYGV